MSDTNNNAYRCEYDETKSGSDVTTNMKNDANRSQETLAKYGMGIHDSTDDDDNAFMSDDAPETSPLLVTQSKRGHQNYRYTKKKSKSLPRSSLGSYSSVTSRAARNRQSPRRAPLSRKSSTGDEFDFDDVIPEGEELDSFPRSHSHPKSLPRNIEEERRSRLVRRRSALTFTSTYRSLSTPPRIAPSTLPSLGSLVMSTTPSVSSMASAQEQCCYQTFPRGAIRPKSSWSNLTTCLAHKKENGYRMTPTQIMIRKSLEKAIQKAGYNMNELALSNSPVASPRHVRKMEPKPKVDWTDSAVVGEHLWGPSNQAGDVCYVGEALCNRSGSRKKCQACHIIVHDSCLEQLDKIGFQCKVTFREASTRNVRDNLIVRHHWVHRRRQEGKCKHCGKVFEKKFGFRDSKILAISCSWCKEAYHNKVSCFQIQKIHEPCALGVHARIIVPPTWIIKWTQRGKSLRNRSKKKRGSSGVWKKKSSREGRSRLFAIRPLPEHTPYLSPTIVFINPKSGGNQGVKILQSFQWLLNQRQVFNLCDGGPKEPLEMFRKVPNLRILACGGDGTVGWILSMLDELNFTRWPPVAILPLGTGNDLSRTLNWGSGYTDEPISKILQHVEEGRVVQLDRWKLHVKPNPDTKLDEDEISSGDAVDQPPLTVVNNYFSLGADAKVVLEFHESREARPSKFNSRIGNKLFYVRTGVTDYLTAKHKNLGKRISVVCDGKDITAKIQALKPVCLLFLNIPRYSAGTAPWGNPAGSEFKPQQPDDKLIEVLALTSNQMGLLYVGGHGERLCQCSEATITTSKAFPIQIDGEPCRLNPSVIKITFHNQANMIMKTKRGSVPVMHDTPVCEPLKICISTITQEQYTKYNGDKAKLRELSKPSHTAVIQSEADLETVRLSIERIHQQQDPEKGQSELRTEQYTFLDSSTGNRFYRIDRTQESLYLVREIATSHREIFVLDCAPAPSPSPDSELDPKHELSRFPRSQLVDKKTIVRRRIQSDTTGSLLVENIGLIQNTSLTPTHDGTRRVATDKFEFESVPESPGEHGDVTDGAMRDYHVTKEKGDDSTLVDKVSGACGGMGNIASNGVMDGTKHNSLPASLTKREAREIALARPLSYTFPDVSNCDATDTSSKLSHCDILKSESYGSVFSSPNLSQRASPVKNQGSNLALCAGVVSSGSLVLQELKDDPQSPKATKFLELTSSQSPTVTSFASSRLSQNSSINSLQEAKSPAHEVKTAHEERVSLTRENELVTHGSIPLPREEEETLAHENKKLSAHEENSSFSPGNESPTVKTAHEENELVTDGSMSPAREDEETLSHKNKKSSAVEATSTPTQSFSPDHGEDETTTHERKSSPAHENIVNLALTDAESSVQRAVSHQSENHSSAVNTPVDSSPNLGSHKKAGMPFSVFVKTQIPPPAEKSTFPIKRRPTGKNVDLSRGRSLTLNEFVTTMDEVSSSDDLQIHCNKQYSDAAKRGDLSKLKKALESGADPLSLDNNGATALHNAAKFNHPSVVLFLIKNGPPDLLHRTDNDRHQTALHKAAWFGHQKVCEILVKAGASLTSVDYKGMTPLQQAGQADDTELVAFLTLETEKRARANDVTVS